MKTYKFGTNSRKVQETLRTPFRKFLDFWLGFVRVYFSSLPHVNPSSAGQSSVFSSCQDSARGSKSFAILPNAAERGPALPCSDCFSTSKTNMKIWSIWCFLISSRRQSGRGTSSAHQRTEKATSTSAYKKFYKAIGWMKKNSNWSSEFQEHPFIYWLI